MKELVLNSVKHASLVITFAKYNQTAFDENHTIVTYLLLSIREDRIPVSKKSADFTDFKTPIKCVQCLKLMRYTH